MRQTGIIYALAAYLIWGFFPLYWKQLESVPALQLIGHRIAWSFLLLGAFIALSRRAGLLLAALSSQEHTDISWGCAAHQRELVHLCLGGNPRLRRRSQPGLLHQPLV